MISIFCYGNTCKISVIQYFATSAFSRARGLIRFAYTLINPVAWHYIRILIWLLYPLLSYISTWIRLHEEHHHFDPYIPSSDWQLHDPAFLPLFMAVTYQSLIPDCRAVRLVNPSRKWHSSIIYSNVWRQNWILNKNHVDLQSQI